jgi:hypothetical protein
MHHKLRFYLILALIISIILEITLFNYTQYATLFTSKHFNIEYDKQKRSFGGNINYFLSGISLKDSLLLPDTLSKLIYEPLNTEIASIYIEPIFIQGDKQSVRISWKDEESSKRIVDVNIIKGLDFSNYITITPRGKVSDLNIQFFDNNIAIKQIELNKKIPMAIMPIRMIIVFGISLLLFCLKNTEFREKISWFCFDYLYDKTNFRQRIGFATLICSMLIFNFLVSYSVYNGFKDNELSAKWHRMYSHYMTDALLKKQVHLDIKVPQALLEAEKPYDNEYREQHGILLNYGQPELDALENVPLGDMSFYKGKYYSYYGMLPVIILFAPYKLLTGNYLPTSIGAFLFASMATILLMLLWKQISQNHLKKIPYFFFLICGATLYASSIIPICLTMKFFHNIPQYLALTFVILGVIMLLHAKEKLSAKLLVISSLSFALAVACRPSSLFWSILIPIMLWDKKKDLINASKILAIIIPFATVGSILAWYNYARFDSPFTFGQSYILMTTNMITYNEISIIGKIYIFIKTFLFMLFNPPILDFTFPFVTAKESYVQLATTNYFNIFFNIVGIFCFPIMWFLFHIRKVNILRNFIIAGIFISLLNITLFVFKGGSVWRYTMDFSWVMAIGTLICAFQLQERELPVRKIILKAFYSCSGITMLLVFFLTISYRIYMGTGFVDHNILDPKIHYYLARTFGVICNVPP